MLFDFGRFFSNFATKRLSQYLHFNSLKILSYSPHSFTNFWWPEVLTPSLFRGFIIPRPYYSAAKWISIKESFHKKKKRIWFKKKLIRFFKNEVKRNLNEKLYYDPFVRISAYEKDSIYLESNLSQILPKKWMKKQNFYLKVIRCFFCCLQNHL